MERVLMGDAFMDEKMEESELIPDIDLDKSSKQS